MKWQRRKSHSLGENINPSSESNCSQCLLAELTKLEEQAPEARMGTGDTDSTGQGESRQTALSVVILQTAG